MRYSGGTSQNEKTGKLLPHSASFLAALRKEKDQQHYTHLRASDLVTAVRDSTTKNAVSNKSATRKNSQISKAV